MHCAAQWNQLSPDARLASLHDTPNRAAVGCVAADPFLVLLVLPDHAHESPLNLTEMEHSDGTSVYRAAYVNHGVNLVLVR